MLHIRIFDDGEIMTFLMKNILSFLKMSAFVRNFDFDFNF